MLRPPFESAQYLSIRYTERRGDAGGAPSVGSVGDSYDNALAETVIGLFKTDVIRRLGPWRRIEDVEIATLQWVDRSVSGLARPPPPARADRQHPAGGSRDDVLRYAPRAKTGSVTRTKPPPENPARFKEGRAGLRRARRCEVHGCHLAGGIRHALCKP